MNTVWAALDRARVARGLQRFEEARRLLGEALVHAPDDPRLLEAMADIAFRLDEDDEALRFARAALAVDPDRFDAHLTAALVSSAMGESETAERHARRAAQLLPHNDSVYLVLAHVLINGPVVDSRRAEARAAVERAVELAPDDADTHAQAAEIYVRLHDSQAAGRHIEAGLAADPLHAGLLHLRARWEFEDVGTTRDKAIATLRGLLGARPDHVEARKLLAEIMWRALLRLVTWLWAFAFTVVVLSIWIGPGVLRVVTSLLFFGLLAAWFRVFRKLRKQLPPRYLRTRLRRRPEAIAALASLVFASLLTNLGVLVLRTDLSAGVVRAGYVLIVAGVVFAAPSHLLLMLAWVRGRDTEADRAAADEYAGFSGFAIVLLGVPLLGLLSVLRLWSRQPAAFWAAVLIVSVVVLAHVLVQVPFFVLEYRRHVTPLRWGAALALVALLATGGTCWGAGQLFAQDFRSADRLSVPEFPEPPHRRPLEMPSLHLTVPPMPPPSGER
ncbi:hypothetical protein AB0H76_05905 [Nocardia sp. NPDC050712]|uniref:tetratricopeptide repeat protein n=1 Tax=Nocardia sp. NPDC050712 TaxID=3155518 RepID=UPI0034001447